MKKETLDSAREIIGEFLRDMREKKNIRIQTMQNAGLRFEIVKAIESGKNYEINSLLTYLNQIGAYIYFADKGEPNTPHDLNDLAEKGIENNPFRKK